MTKLSIEGLSDIPHIQESRLEELQKKYFQEDSLGTVQRDPVYDLYIDGRYLYLNVDLPGVLKQELSIIMKEAEIRITGEFPKLVDLDKVEFLQNLRAKGPFEYNFLIPDNLKVQKYDWQLVNGILQVRLVLINRKQTELLTE